MKLQLESTVVIPLGVSRKFMSKWDEDTVGEDEEDDAPQSILAIDIKYPPLNYDGEIYWNEMSYHRLKDNITDWNYDLYSNGEW